MGMIKAAAMAKIGDVKGAQNQGSSFKPLQNMKSGSLPPDDCNFKYMAKP